MRGYCESCGATTRVPSRRGNRLADARCPECGGQLRGLTAGRPSRARGRRYGRCELCGRRRLGLWRITREGVSRLAYDDRAGKYVEEPVRPGTLACMHHWVRADDGSWGDAMVRDVGEPVP